VKLPLLWICGPPGSGKSTVGWEVRARIAAGGVDVAYVDVDQLGICYPEPEDDPSRTRLQARILAPMIDGFAGEGATGVVVSGVTDSESESASASAVGSSSRELPARPCRRTTAGPSPPRSLTPMLTRLRTTPGVVT
jgi:hypothetical protein